MTKKQKRKIAEKSGKNEHCLKKLEKQMPEKIQNGDKIERKKN